MDLTTPRIAIETTSITMSKRFSFIMIQNEKDDEPEVVKRAWKDERKKYEQELEDKDPGKTIFLDQIGLIKCRIERNIKEIFN